MEIESKHCIRVWFHTIKFYGMKEVNLVYGFFEYVRTIWWQYLTLNRYGTSIYTTVCFSHCWKLIKFCTSCQEVLYTKYKNELTNFQHTYFIYIHMQPNIMPSSTLLFGAANLLYIMPLRINSYPHSMQKRNCGIVLFTNRPWNSLMVAMAMLSWRFVMLRN
jgi:hypothetical protein